MSSSLKTISSLYPSSFCFSILLPNFSNLRKGFPPPNVLALKSVGGGVWIEGRSKCSFFLRLNALEMEKEFRFFSRFEEGSVTYSLHTAPRVWVRMRERENEFDPCQVQVLKYKKRLRNLGFFRGVELSMATTDARRGASCLRFSCRRMRLEPGNQGMKTQNSSSSTCDSKPLDYLASFLNFSACNIAAGGNVMYFLQEMERACDTGKDE